MIPIFGTVILMVFVIAFFAVISGFWRMRGMANKVFTLAEQEMERKLRESAAQPGAADDAIPSPTCSHCGRRVTANVAQCPNCGAGLP